MSSFWNSPAWSMGKRSSNKKKENIAIPGPGNYNSASNIAKHNPAWKIGGALRDASKIGEGPGPGEYNITSSKSGPKITMGAKSKGFSIGEGLTPGPGNYSSATTGIYKHPSAFTMGAKYGQTKIQDPQPGPGTYNLHAQLKRTGAKIGKSNRGGLGANNKDPGPGQYSNSRPFSAGPKYGFGNEMRSHATLEQKPGPGQYQIGDMAISYMKGCVFGQKASKKNLNIENPGPGSYQVYSKRPMSGTKIGRSERNKQTGSIGPGPGAYQFGYKAKGSSQIKIGTGQRTHFDKGQTPGPGAYQLNKSDKKGVTISGFKSKHQLQVTPGPGTYDVNSVLRPCSAKIGKSLRSNLNSGDTPGPGQYFPKDPNSCHFAFSKQLRSRDMKGGDPGPGQYQIPVTVPSAPHYLLDPSVYKQSYQ